MSSPFWLSVSLVAPVTDGNDPLTEVIPVPLECIAQSFPFPTVDGSDGAGAVGADRETLSALVVWSLVSLMVEDETDCWADPEDEACITREK